MCIYLHSLSPFTPLLVSAVQVMNSSVALYKYLLADSFFNGMTPECYQLASRWVCLFRISLATVHLVFGEEQSMPDPAFSDITREICNCSP